MESAITPRSVGLNNNIANKRAKRYIFYGMSNLDLSGTQATSPVWKPKIPRARIVLLEPFEYYTQTGEEVQVYTGGGVKLELAEMGTDAQVKFLLDSYGEKGLAELKSLTNVEPEIAVKIESLLYPTDSIPNSLVELQQHFASLDLNPKDAIQEKAIEVVGEIQEGINRAIAWANSYCTMIEREIQSSRAGRAGRPSMTPTDHYYYKQIKRATPRDNDLNFGGQDEGLANTLKNLLGASTTNPMEIETYKSTMEEQKQIINQLIAQNQELMASKTEEKKK